MACRMIAKHIDMVRGKKSDHSLMRNFEWGTARLNYLCFSMCGLWIAIQQENCSEVLWRWEAEKLAMQKQIENTSWEELGRLSVLVETIN